MLKADELYETSAKIDGMWVCARPMINPFIRRVKDAIRVLKGECDAVKFYKQ